MAEPWTDAWSHALDAFEMDVAEAEALIAAGHLIDSAPASTALAWQAPTNLGPLPGSLRDRAARILERQLDMAARLADAARSTRQQMRVVDDLRKQAPVTPVYIDTIG
ncbi:hypothetical protein [Sanguibacter suaedae]|uniref:Uncharacterized protein n=1 Tax=Sanguibacter suaedae TaxID=2795737 RepID=A0A934M6S2_9MICO|nr:hypothetical protein [Sanguibacter suaedae]MBI9114567.1 hypothetical protein [Sanguibacter suaedae]